MLSASECCRFGASRVEVELLVEVSVVKLAALSLSFCICEGRKLLGDIAEEVSQFVVVSLIHKDVTARLDVPRAPDLIPA